MADYDGLDKVFTVNGFCKYGRIQIGQIEYKTSAKSILETHAVHRQRMFLPIRNFGMVLQLHKRLDIHKLCISLYVHYGWVYTLLLHKLCMHWLPTLFKTRNFKNKMLIAIIFVACEVTDSGIMKFIEIMNYLTWAVTRN